MNANDIVAVFSRFFALYILYQILFHSLPSVTFGVFADNVDFQNLGPIITIFLCSLIMFLFFWFGSDWVAEIILGPNKDKRVEAKTELKTSKNQVLSLLA